MLPTQGFNQGGALKNNVWDIRFLEEGAERKASKTCSNNKNRWHVVVGHDGWVEMGNDEKRKRNRVEMMKE